MYAHECNVCIKRMNVLAFSTDLSIPMFINVVYVQRRRNKRGFLIGSIVFSRVNVVYECVDVLHGFYYT